MISSSLHMQEEAFVSPPSDASLSCPASPRVPILMLLAAMKFAHSLQDLDKERPEKQKREKYKQEMEAECFILRGQQGVGSRGRESPSELLVYAFTCM
jgi:hypothetical protein